MEPRQGELQVGRIKFLPDAPLSDDTEFAFFDKRPFVNAVKHEQVAGRLCAERDFWIRMFNRLSAAIEHHRKAERFPDDADEALWKATDRVLKQAAKGAP